MASQSSATLAAPLAASLAATSLDPSLEEARSSSARMPTYILTLIVSTLVIAIFFRSILPRIPRFFLRGRLRIKRIGLRGVRGIEWRSKGFSVIRGGASSSASSAAPSRSGTPNRNQSAYGDEAVEEDGLVIRIQRVCLVFRGWRSRSRRRCPSVSRHPGMDSEQEEHWEARKPSSWLTIHIQGVGIRLPRSAQDEEAVNARRAKAKAAEEAEVQEEKRKHEKNEERLRELMKSAPATPASARLPRTPTPSEAPNLPTERNQVPLPAPLAQSLRTLPFYFLRRFVLHIRYKAIPRTCGLVLRALRAQLYIIASSLPAFSSLVDIEVHRMEVYIKEAETVVRMGRVGAEVSMSMISSRHNDCKTEGLAGRSSFSDESPASGLGVSPGRLRDVIAAMPERIGSGAKGAMSYVMAGIPAGRANLRLRFEGVQMFEASLGCTEKSSSSPTQARARATSPPLTPRRKVSAVNRAGSSGHGAGTDEASPPVDGQWLGSRIGVLPSRPLSPPSLKRSNSASVLNTMSTLSLSGWTDRWADWALEPYPNSNFSSDTGWARGAAAHSSAGIPDSARLLSLPGTSRFDLGLLLGPSFSVKAKEAVQVEVGIAEMTVGVNAVVRVLSILEQRKARRVGPVPTAAGAQG